MGFIAWIVVGLIAGWLAGKVMKGGGYGVLVDIILGILGGVLGGWVFGHAGNLAGRRHDRVDCCGICWRRDFDLAYASPEKSLKGASHSLHAEQQPVGNALPCSRRLREGVRFLVWERVYCLVPVPPSPVSVQNI